MQCIEKPVMHTFIIIFINWIVTIYQCNNEITMAVICFHPLVKNMYIIAVLSSSDFYSLCFFDEWVEHKLLVFIL